MLQAICEHIHNRFNKREDGSPVYILTATFTISDGTLSPTPALKEGQRFLITGSDLNDGIYTYHASGLTNDDDTAGAGLADEVFYGAVHGLSVPPQVIALSAEITEWVAKYGDVINSPYQSESFGGYSYTRASGAGANGTGAAGWQTVFRDRLSRWRKVSY